MLGLRLGDSDGEMLGVRLGLADGLTVGPVVVADGLALGLSLGITVGASVGHAVHAQPEQSRKRGAASNIAHVHGAPACAPYKTNMS